MCEVQQTMCEVQQRVVCNNYMPSHLRLHTNVLTFMSILLLHHTQETSLLHVFVAGFPRSHPFVSCSHTARVFSERSGRYSEITRRNGCVFSIRCWTG